MTDLLRLVTWRDFLDIFLVAIVIYNLLLLIRGTRAVQILLGISFIGVAYFMARAFQLLTLQRIIENLSLFLPLAIIVLFQHEIRRALASFGRNPLLNRGAGQEVVESMINEIVLAATSLSNHRIGALIVIERLQGLRNFIENGIEMDAAVGYDLLINIFTPGTPLHDGAAIIQNDRIAAAACFLPLTSNPELSTACGTRHRAALGISEETDALAVVVSEETARISVAIDGELISDLDSKGLRNLLFQMILSDSYIDHRRSA